MPDLQDQRLRLAAARADFLDGGEAAGVPDVVAASWRRSLIAGVQASSYSVPYHVDIDTDSRLVRCARPVLERLTSDMSDVPVSIALADSRARVVERRDCSTAVGRVFDRMDFSPGFSFAEGLVGTNGIGTVFEAGVPVSVVGSAHYNESLTPFACTGAPVIEPISGRLEGVLDVSLLAESWSPLIHALVRTAAADIGRNLMLDRSRAQQALFETYVKADARSRHAVVAVGESIIVNQRAQHLLSPDDQVALQHHARFLMGRPHVTDDVLHLPDGRALHLRVVRVRAGDDTSGVVLLVSEVPHDRGAVSPSFPLVAARTSDKLPEHHEEKLTPLAPPISRTPAWNQAWAEVEDALVEGRSVVLTGECGSGRLTLLAEVFDRHFVDGDHRVVDAQDLLRVEVPDGVSAALLVLRAINRLDRDTARQALDLLDRCHPATRFAATLDEPLPERHPALAVLARFERSVAVPALRHRAEDVPHLAETMLAELAPGRRLRISPAAARTLSAYTWPGNVPQLRQTLVDTLTRRPVGEIQADDLPGHTRSLSRRPLSPLESAERDAIVVALRERGGNRVQAASRLGMSRSSLYRKLKHYRLDDL